MNKFLFIATVIMLTSCSGVRNLSEANLNLPEKYITGEAVDSMSAADISWMEFYTDSKLRKIIRKTLDNNHDLRIAAARVEELRQLYGVDKLNYLPVIKGVAAYDRETDAYHGKKKTVADEVDLKGTVSWEADILGGLSYARKKSAATFVASEYDRRGMEITLIAEAATAYFNYIATGNELNIVRKTIKTREQALEKALLRFEGGLTSEIVYQQSKVELATTEALLPGIIRRIELSKNALFLLMGEYPDSTLTSENIEPTLFREDLPAILPVGIPSDLIQRRPDIIASEYRLKAALANAGVAYSNQFPKFAISLTGGWENDDAPALLKSPFSYIIGNITGTIFDFGRNHRKYKAQCAAYEQAKLAYEKCVLNAFVEVENAIITTRQMQNTVNKRLELKEAAMKYVTLANKQYIGGTINYIDVLDAQRRYFEAQVSHVNSLRDQYLAVVQLYKALGGGFENRGISK